LCAVGTGVVGWCARPRDAHAHARHAPHARSLANTTTNTNTNTTTNNNTTNTNTNNSKNNSTRRAALTSATHSQPQGRSTLAASCRKEP
jgi:hypothetical protein